jgi:hypothetical protein
MKGHASRSNQMSQVCGQQWPSTARGFESEDTALRLKVNHHMTNLECDLATLGEVKAMKRKGSSTKLLR